MPENPFLLGQNLEHRLWKSRFHRSGLENISRRRATPPFVTFVASRTRAAEFDPKFLSDHYKKSAPISRFVDCKRCCTAPYR